MKPKSNQKPLRPELKIVSRNLQRLKWVLLVSTLVLLFVGNGFGAERRVATPEQPAQIWSRVHYDPNLRDPFFQSNDWSYPWYIVKHPDGHFESTRSKDISPIQNPPRLRHTAKCFSTFTGGEHLISFCKAKLIDANKIDLFIEEENASFVECLRIQTRNGMFTCNFAGLTDIPPLKGFASTTKRQELTLDKKVYRKGDVIKGKVYFERVDKMTNPKHIEEYGRVLKTIKVFGVFKTIVE